MVRVVLLGVVCNLRDPPRSEDYPPAGVSSDPNHVGWSPLTREAIEEDLASGRHDNPAQQSFDLTEFAELDDSSRLTLRDDRGFTSRASDGDFWRHASAERLEQGVLSTLLPEDDDPRRPRRWMVERLSELGIATDIAALEGTSYRVEFTPRLLKRLREEQRPA